MTEGFVQLWWLPPLLHRADKHRSGHRRAQSSAGCQTLPRSRVNMPAVCSEWLFSLVCFGWCCWRACCWCPSWPRPAQGVCTRPRAQQGSGGWAASCTSWWISWYQLETNGQEPCSGTLGAGTKAKILYLLLWNSHQARKSCTAWPTMTKHRLDPAQMRWFPRVDRSPCSLLVWLTVPCSDVWDPANKIITSSQSQSSFVGTLSFLSSLHLWRKTLSCSQGRSHNLH